MRKTPHRNRAAIYARISDARDGDTAGVQRQQDDCRALAATLGLEVVDTYVDNNRSAMHGARPEYERLLADLDAGRFDMILVYSVERLYRRLADLEHLVDALGDVPVRAVRSGDIDLATADGRLVARLLGSVASHESEKRGERVARAAAQRAKEGRFGGGKRRLGYTDGCTALMADEADVIRDGYRTIAEGGSVRAVTRDWQDRLGTGPDGGRITPMQVRDVLLRPLNAGIAVYKGAEVGRSQSPAIIDETTYRLVRSILTDPTRVTNRGRPATSLLSGILRCGICGGPMVARTRGREAGGKRHPIYACQAKGHVSRQRVRVDEAITGLLLAHLEDNAERIEQAAVRRTEVKVDPSLAEAERLQRELDSLASLLAAGEVTAAGYAAGERALRDRLRALEESMARDRGRLATAHMLNGGDLAQAWDTMSSEERRSIVRENVESIVVGRSPAGIFSMEGITVNWRGQ